MRTDVEVGMIGVKRSRSCFGTGPAPFRRTRVPGGSDEGGFDEFLEFFRDFTSAGTQSCIRSINLHS